LNRNATLLEFAIGASLAVVPVLLAVLLIVAWWRPLDASQGGARDPDHHVGARQVAALKTFERAIVRRSEIRKPPGDAAELIAAIPACRAEWQGKERAVDRVRAWIGGARNARSSPADRIAAHVARLDDALRTFSTQANRRVVDAVGIDVARWGEAVTETLRAPVESPDYPGRRFTVRCEDIAGAVDVLVRNDARMLHALAWRGTEVARTVARWRPDQYVEISGRHVARANPWLGVAGCVYMGSVAKGRPEQLTSLPYGGSERSERGGPERSTYFVSETRGMAERVCADGEGSGAAAIAGTVGEPAPRMAVDDARWSVPPSLSAMLQPLDAMKRPASNGDASLVRVGSARLPVGDTVDVTIDPALQSIAQRVAACYTGRQDVCRVLGLARKEDDGKPVGHRLLEQALVRMAAVAIIDVETGRIEALAGSLSPCTREEFDGPGRSPQCDRRMPYPIRYNPDALLNPAVYHDAMPASTIKPVMAAAFLSDPVVGKTWIAAERAEMQRTPWPTRDSLRGQLMRSDSARFLDRMFCLDRKPADCRRPWEVQAATLAFGWNVNCAQDAHEGCGKRNLLFGNPIAGIAGAVPFGRLMVEPASGAPGAPMRVAKSVPLDPVKVTACAAGPDGRRGTKDDWEKCRARKIVDVAAEGWGQGNARATALGAAGMIASLAAAANGDVPAVPHLVASVRAAGTTDAKLVAAARGASDSHLTREIAEVIVSGLSYSHRAGTARLACEQVFDAKACRDIDWIAGKTGTPTFPNDDLTLDDLARLCAPSAARPRADATSAKAREIAATCGALRPYKWYVATYRSDPANPRWTKAIGVLTERNWLAESGRIHGAGDHGPNPAAEIAMQIAGRHAGKIGAAP
jgi:hypothetical protein